MAEYTHEIDIKAKDPLEAQVKLTALITLAENISPENLAVLAEKSKKPRINEKIKQFKNFI